MPSSVWTNGRCPPWRTSSIPRRRATMVPGSGKWKLTKCRRFAILKVANYWLEVLAGLTLLASHLVIWYFCPERNVELGDELPDIQHQYRNMDQERSRTHEDATVRRPV
mmetsp:Transcript_93404/g.273463  ORF Transcript_93404/g.273463 Transcript_93404/m.273463 type:complete len:109 (+) Transcript_93404:652-978(+)